MVWIGCVHCEKLWCDFVARTSSLIAPVQPILHRVLSSIKTLESALKHYEMIQNMSFVKNGVDRVHSLRKILMRLYGTNLCINCTSSTHFAMNGINTPHWTLNSYFGASHRVWVHLTMFHYYTKLVPKRVELVQLMHKFVPWSHFRIFHNERTQCTQLDKLMVVCIS